MKRRRVMARPVRPEPTHTPPDRRLIAAIAGLVGLGVVLVLVWAMLPRSPGPASSPRASGTPVAVPRSPQTIAPTGSISPPTAVVPTNGATAPPLATPGPSSTTGTPGPIGQNPGLRVNWQDVAAPGLGEVLGVTAAASANGRVVVIGDAT